ncbi:Transcription factor Iwr1 protein [Rutstroemia sp. NJR-2017a BBW]|nr:Transcription factor Iwr1 protein [Rutstroemia sp. NJR-2017a BBW]
MSLPPSVIHIKRKATDEPLEFLHPGVHESAGKRQRRANDFVFSRQTTPQSDTPTPPPSVLPAGRRIKPLHRASSSRSLANKAPSKPSAVSQTINEVKNEVQPAISPSPATTKPDFEVKRPTSSPSPKKAQPRRFHISRSATPTIPPTSDSGIRKRTQKATTIFVERRVRQKTSQEKQLSSTAKFAAPLENALQTKEEEERPRKKPGRGSRVPVPQKDATKPAAQSKPPPALVNPWGLDTDDLAAQMQAYTLQEIGRSILESQSQSASPIRTTPSPAPSSSTRSPHKLTSTSTSKFKPKKPALRYKERHPEASMELDDADSDIEVEDEDMDTDSEYIIDTYIRLPAEDIQDSGEEINFGLLVLDSRMDEEEFYRVEGEEEEDEDEEGEEDENAENHYSADYPDEEVESDDEYGRNAYAYRNGNASDLEEWDAVGLGFGKGGMGRGSDSENEEEDGDEDMRFSDDEVDGLKFPWMRRG